MDINQYTYEAMKTRLPSADENYVMLGLIGEVGELYSLLAKSIRDEKELDIEMVKSEVADCVWFLAALATDFGFTLSEALEKNLKKLQKRKEKGTIQGSGEGER